MCLEQRNVTKISYTFLLLTFNKTKKRISHTKSTWNVTTWALASGNQRQIWDDHRINLLFVETRTDVMCCLVSSILCVYRCIKEHSICLLTSWVCFRSSAMCIVCNAITFLLLCQITYPMMSFKISFTLYIKTDNKCKVGNEI